MNKSVLTATIAIFLLFTLSAFSQSTIKRLVLRPGPTDGIDADIRNDMPATPQGASKDFIANAWTAQGNFFVQRSLLKFDLSQIPTEAKIISATLFLYTNLNTGHYQLDSGANAAYLLRVTEPWSENLVCWNNQPSASLQYPVILPQSLIHTQNYEVDVIAHVSEMVVNPAGNHGWLFRLQTEEMYRCMVFASSDNPVVEWRPKLIVEYTNCTDPVANFSFIVHSRDVRFTDLSNHASTWFWTFGDETSSNEQNPSHTYASPGSYKVCLNIGDSCGTSSHCDTVEIECFKPEAGFSYDLSYTTVNFTDTSLCINPLSWFWEFGDSTTSTVQNPEHEYSQNGTYEVCLTITDSCGEDMQCMDIGVYEPLKPGFSTSQNEVNNLKVSFVDKSSGATWWLWDFGDGKSSPVQNPVHVFKQYGEYEVCITAGNAFTHEKACDLLKVKMINIHANGKKILFYPNPYPGSGKHFFILFEDTGMVGITVTDLAGKMILKHEYRDIKSNEPVELKLNGLGKGTYILESSFNNSRMTTKLEVL